MLGLHSFDIIVTIVPPTASAFPSNTKQEEKCILCLWGTLEMTHSWSNRCFRFTYTLLFFPSLTAILPIPNLNGATLCEHN